MHLRRELSDVVVHGETGPLDQMQPTCTPRIAQQLSGACSECWTIETFGNFESDATGSGRKAHGIWTPGAARAWTRF